MKLSQLWRNAFGAAIENVEKLEAVATQQAMAL